MDSLVVGVWMFLLFIIAIGLLVPVSIMAWREVLKKKPPAGREG
jgi:hypothetical protein